MRPTLSPNSKLASLPFLRGWDFRSGNFGHGPQTFQSQRCSSHCCAPCPAGRRPSDEQAKSCTEYRRELPAIDHHSLCISACSIPAKKCMMWKNRYYRRTRQVVNHQAGVQATCSPTGQLPGGSATSCSRVCTTGVGDYAFGSEIATTPVSDFHFELLTVRGAPSYQELL